MTRRLRHADTATAGRFPLRPGKPLVHRQRNGAWGYTCHCAGHNRRTVSWCASYNCNDWAHALWLALDHVAHHHKTYADHEIESLEAAYALPAAERTHP
ncbi:hypothetical protein [Streptomyces pilosus]|uniref:hypothetical protein n=1 Tax=Streptomyces pilosus TaxID=28893 RepID=UPI0036451469